MRDNYKTTEELEAGLDEVLQSPVDGGAVELIVCRPANGEREVLTVGELDASEGLLGDNWRTRGSRHTADGTAHPEMQLNLMNARVVDLVAGTRERWPLAGDQLFVDLDLSPQNVPPGTRLAVGDAVIEVTAVPHKGCKKFVARFGIDAMRFVNSERGRALQLRGINAKVVQSGVVRAGDVVCKLKQ